MNLSAHPRWSCAMARPQRSSAVRGERDASGQLEVGKLAMVQLNAAEHRLGEGVAVPVGGSRPRQRRGRGGVAVDQAVVEGRPWSRAARWPWLARDFAGRALAR